MRKKPMSSNTLLLLNRVSLFYILLNYILFHFDMPISHFAYVLVSSRPSINNREYIFFTIRSVRNPRCFKLNRLLKSHTIVLKVKWIQNRRDNFNDLSRRATSQYGRAGTIVSAFLFVSSDRLNQVRFPLNRFDLF